MLWVGFPWGPGRTKPFCWMLALWGWGGHDLLAMSTAGTHHPANQSPSRALQAGVRHRGQGGSKEGVPSDSSQLHLPASHPPTDVRGHLTKWPGDQREDAQDGHHCWQHTMPLGSTREKLLTYPSSFLQRFLNLWMVSDSVKRLLPISFCLTFLPWKRL